MRKPASLIFAFMLGAGMAQAETIQLTLQEYPPYMGEKLPYQGLLTRVVVAAFAQQKIGVKLESVPNRRAIDGVRMGLYSGGFGWAKNPEREKDLFYTDPVLSLRMVFCQGAKVPGKNSKIWRATASALLLAIFTPKNSISSARRACCKLIPAIAM
jgi:polar amino acid transport system substrate-binding protein